MQYACANEVYVQVEVVELLHETQGHVHGIEFVRHRSELFEVPATRFDAPVPELLLVDFPQEAVPPIDPRANPPTIHRRSHLDQWDR